MLYFQTFVCVIKGAQIGLSLKNLAERRTDIFGSEETVIGRKVHTYIQYIKGIGWLFIIISPPASCTHIPYIFKYLLFDHVTDQ